MPINQQNIADRLYNAVLLPLDNQLRVDEQAFRRFLRYFLAQPRFVEQGGLCINPEAGEIFYLTRAEKRRVLEIAMEEARLWVQKGRLVYHKLTTLSAMATAGLTSGWLLLADGEELSYDTLVIATGAHARKLPGQPSHPRIHLLRTLDDSIALRGPPCRSSTTSNLRRRRSADSRRSSRTRVHPRRCGTTMTSLRSG